MTLKRKMLLFFATLMAALVAVLAAISLYSFREFSLYTAERHARSVAESVKVGLTESMVNGTISKRAEFLQRLVTVPGVESIRVVRAPAVVNQFGPGLTQEHASNELENRVLTHGEPIFETESQDGKPVFRAIIPYTASDRGTPNCLQCHIVANGTTLGAISIDIPLSEVRREGMLATAGVILSILLASLLALFFLGRLLRPLVGTAEEVRKVVAQGVDGNFGGRLKQHTSDEVGEIAGNLNRLMQFLDSEITTISRRVGQLMNQPPQIGGNQLVTTTEMVEGLVEAAQFKQAIEEDQSKTEVYQRLAQVLKEKYDIPHFSIYEIASSKNRITPIIVDDEVGAGCRWCDQQILIDAAACRVRRTGHEVNAVDFPGLCTMFRNVDDGEARTHICLPITQSGSVGCVVQMVLPVDGAMLGKLMVPYISVYLRETAPVLEAKRLMEHLRESSLRDAMTGLYNRRFLEEYITTLVATTQRRKSSFSVLMLDLDYFKQVNDNFGHESGDKVLKVLAEILGKSVRASDLVIRYGGEEFLICLLDTAADQAMAVAEKIRAKVEETKVQLPGTLLQKTISIGVSEYPVDADTFWQVVKYADVALYQAKERGRNRVIRFLAEMWQDNKEY